MLLALIACSETPSAAPPAPPPPPKVEAPKPPAGLTCCDTPAATAAVQAYVALNAALAADKDGEAELAALNSALANEPSLAAQGPSLAALAGKPIKEKRDALKPVAAAFVAFARAHGGGSLTVREAFCPMASAGWLQSGDTIQNPYYGSEMPTCGSFR